MRVATLRARQRFAVLQPERDIAPPSSRERARVLLEDVEEQGSSQPSGARSTAPEVASIKPAMICKNFLHSLDGPAKDKSYARSTSQVNARREHDSRSRRAPPAKGNAAVRRSIRTRHPSPPLTAASGRGALCRSAP